MSTWNRVDLQTLGSQPFKYALKSSQLLLPWQTITVQILVSDLQQASWRPWEASSESSILRAKFHVPVPIRFFNGWETGDIIPKMGDVTHFMQGYFYVGCRFVSISYFLTEFGEW